MKEVFYLKAFPIKIDHTLFPLVPFPFVLFFSTSSPANRSVNLPTLQFVWQKCLQLAIHIYI